MVKSTFVLGNAAFQGKWDKAMELVQRGESLDATNKAGNSAVHIAAARGFCKFTAVLVGTKCDLSITDTNGRTGDRCSAADMRHT